MGQMRLFFVRHGQTVWNVLRKVQGSSDIPLTDDGLQQARDFALHNISFQAHHFDSVYTSDLQRAVQTAEILAEAKGISALTPVVDLRERFLGDFEGKPLGEMIPRLKDWEALPEPEKWTHGVANSEPFSVLIQRLMDFFTRLHSVHSKDSCVLLLTHSDVMRALYLHITSAHSLANMVGFHNLGHMVVQLDGTQMSVLEADGQVII